MNQTEGAIVDLVTSCDGKNRSKNERLGFTRDAKGLESGEE